jgi:glutamyl-Q tRNA(Asp) synthetase
MGSLLAATASYLDAKSRKGDWLVRIDDVDTARSVPGAAEQILRTLEAHGLQWDDKVDYQTEHLDKYQAAVETLAGRKLIFYCRCSRRSLSRMGVYPGKCRDNVELQQDAAIRIRVDEARITFTDLIQGRQLEHLAETVGDFIIRRRDGLIAYQLATAVDDGDPRITHVARGSDLLSNTSRQLYLMALLDLSPPIYAHVPTLVDANGKKLSKQSHAPPVDASRPAANLLSVFGYLGLKPPGDPYSWNPDTLLAWGCENWSLQRLTGRSTVSVV